MAPCGLVVNIDKELVLSGCPLCKVLLVLGSKTNATPIDYTTLPPREKGLREKNGELVV